MIGVNMYRGEGKGEEASGTWSRSGISPRPWYVHPDLTEACQKMILCHLNGIICIPALLHVYMMCALGWNHIIANYILCPVLECEQY